MISSFEGFGAKLEVGLPFLRGAGIPLPDGLTLDALEVEDGALTARGTLAVRPIDYATILAEVQDLRSTAARRAPEAMTFDAEAVVTDERSPPAGALPRGT